MRLLMFAIAAAVTLPLAAATRYAIAVETTGDVLQRPLSATLLAEGSQRRIDVVRPETPFTFDLLLSDDGGVTFTGLNTALKTWFRIGPMALVGRPRIYAPMLNARRSVGGVKVTASDEPSEAIAGFATRTFVVKTSFAAREEHGGTKVDVLFGATAMISTTDDVDAVLAVRDVDLTTGLPDVDAQLAPALANIRGFPLKIILTATRVYAGGRPQTFTVAATVSDIRTVDAPPHAFERPKGYVNQPPVIGAPIR